VTPAPRPRQLLLGRLQAGLGVLWLIDGVLQLQPANRGAPFAEAVVGNAMGQPAWMQHLLVFASSLLATAPTAVSLALAIGELVLGTAIVLPRFRRPALVASIPFALSIWLVGEGLGNVPTGFAMLPSGAPGAALLYAVAAVILLPAAGPGSTPTVARRRAAACSVTAAPGWCGRCCGSAPRCCS